VRGARVRRLASRGGKRLTHWKATLARRAGYCSAVPSSGSRGTLRRHIGIRKVALDLLRHARCRDHLAAAAAFLKRIAPARIPISAWSAVQYPCDSSSLRARVIRCGSSLHASATVSCVNACAADRLIVETRVQPLRRLQRAMNIPVDLYGQSSVRRASEGGESRTEIIDRDSQTGGTQSVVTRGRSMMESRHRAPSVISTRPPL